MYVLGMLGASTYWPSSTEKESIQFPEQRPQMPEIEVYMVEDEVTLPKVEEIVFSTTEVPYALADTGASTGVAGIEWLERAALELNRYGLKPIKDKATQKFRGLGSAKREAVERWTSPIGIGGKHTVQQYYAIPGGMIGLTGRDDLEEWSTNLYLRKTGHRADFENLGVYGKELIKTNKGHARLDIFDYDLDTIESDPTFMQFRIQKGRSDQ